MSFTFSDVARERGTASPRSLSRAFGARKRAVFDAVPAVQVLQDYQAIPTTYVQLRSEADLLALVGDPRVVTIQPNRSGEASLAQSLPLIRAPQANAAGATGANTAVAVLDTGVDYTRPAFGTCPAVGAPGCSVAHAQDFAPNDNALDNDGHGTNVSGIVLGVAPQTRILGLDVFQSTPQGQRYDDTFVLGAIDFAIRTQSQFGTRALNLSLGDGSHHTTECASNYTGSFASARSVGILPIVAAGNDARVNGQFVNGVSSPACTAGAVRVGAVYDSNVGPRSFGRPPLACTDATTAPDQITCFSQSGPLLSVLAPGAMIAAAGIEQAGTSQATPHVAGATAALASAVPGATPAALEQALAASGPAITDPRNGITRHRIDVVDALTTLRPLVVNQPPICRDVRSTVEVLWPPNHAFRLVGVGGATDPNGDPLRLVVTGITQDEPVNGRGDGNTFPDAQFTAAGDQVLLRAERSGRGDGRVYRLAFSVTDPSGASCSGVVTVTVPHDQSHAAVDSGGSFNSLVAAAGPQPSPGNRAKPTPNKP